MPRRFRCFCLLPCDCHCTPNRFWIYRSIDLTSAMHSITNENGSASLDQVVGVLASTNHARPRPKHIPRHTSNNYLDYRANRTTALRTAVHHLEQELGLHSTVSHISLGPHVLTLHPNNSQSKLSQQELSDLQKATHFDKKELQQWYKGRVCLQSIFGCHDSD